MKNTTAIMHRELLSLFCSPIAYIVIAAFLVITGVLMLVFKSFAPGQPANLRGVFDLTPYLLTAIIPAITMRMLSEEYRNGTLESLMTAPVTDVQIVLGKFAAGLVFYLAMIFTTLVYLVMLMIFGNPDLGAAFAGYLGLLLIGLPFLGFGLLTSSITNNQIVAWTLGTVPLLLLVSLARWVVNTYDDWRRVLFQNINVIDRFEMFSRGVVSPADMIAFVGAAAFLVFCTIKVVESRRWR